MFRSGWGSDGERDYSVAERRLAEQCRSAGEERGRDKIDLVEIERRDDPRLGCVRQRVDPRQDRFQRVRRDPFGLDDNPVDQSVIAQRGCGGVPIYRRKDPATGAGDGLRRVEPSCRIACDDHGRWLARYRRRPAGEGRRAVDFQHPTTVRHQCASASRGSLFVLHHLRILGRGAVRHYLRFRSMGAWVLPAETRSRLHRLNKRHSGCDCLGEATLPGREARRCRALGVGERTDLPDQSSAFTISSPIFLASASSIIVLSM